jgi:hypothetical protein
MESWFCIWDDLLRLFAIAQVANPKNGLNLVLKPLYFQKVSGNFQTNTLYKIESIFNKIKKHRIGYNRNLT